MTEENNSTLIHIEDLEPAKEALPLSTPSSILSNLTKEQVYCTSIDTDIIDFGAHSAYKTFITAYQNHYPITLSPDIIWLLILQGFSRYVFYNAETLRKYFVAFEGKKEVHVEGQVISPETATKEEWEQIFFSLGEKVAENVGKDFVNEITPNFTTTNSTSTTACQLTMMASFKRYFSYRYTMCKCGIPYVNLEGSAEDWHKVKDKVQALAKYKLPWADHLNNIINEFINSKEGKINKNFWKTMVRYKDGHDIYDPSHYSGWFIYLFPYDNGGNPFEGKININHRTANELLNCQLVIDFIGLGSSMRYDFNILSGFVGAKQDPETLSIKPEIGWIVEKYQPNSEKQDSSYDDDDNDYYEDYDDY